MKKILFILVNLLFLSTTQAELWKINKDHSEINFEIPYMGVSSVTGKFLSFKGSVDISDESLNNLNITIQTSSIFTANKMRDQHLREPDFLNVEKFESITFKAKNTTPLSPGKFRVIGELNFNGIRKEVSFPINLTELKKDTWGYDSRFVSFRFQIDRSDYNLSWNKTMAQNEVLIGKLVNISGVIQIQPSGAMTPFAKHKIPDTKGIRLAQQLKRGEITQREYEKAVGMDKTFDARPSKDYKKSPKHNKEVMTSKVPENDDQQYQEFSKESIVYYLSSMFVALFGMLGIYYFYILIMKKEEQGKLSSKQAKAIFLIVFTIYLWSAYIVSFDDFMAFSISLLKLI